jgi:hypothetical protein
MKNLVLFFFLILFTNSCDDGELTIENFNFGNAIPTTCNAGQTGFFIYKTNGKEVIILKIDENKFLNPIVTNPTLLTQDPIEITGNVEVIYRIYSDNINTSFLCTSPPPTSPNVIEEWKALSGTITITSTAIKTEDAATNSSRITGFNHEINIKNLNFKKPDGSEQLFVNFNFGAYKNTFSAFPETFGIDDPTGICISNNNLTKLSKRVGSQSIILEAPSIFGNNTNNINVTTNHFINNTTIKLSYNLYKEEVSTSGICANSTPTLLQKWEAETAETTNGIVKVLKQPELNSSMTLIGYKYTITLSNINFKKGSFIFKSGTSYNFGTFIRLN